MSKTRKNGKAGNGIGCWQEHGAMGHATRTKSKEEKRRQFDRKQKQRGWD